MVNVSRWEGEDVLITFEAEGKDVVTNYQGKINRIGVSGGAQNLDTFYAFGNVQIDFNKPRDKFTVALDVQLTDTRFAQPQFGGSAYAAGVEFRSSSDAPRYRIIVWFVPAANIKSNSAKTIRVPKKSGEIYRWIFSDCRTVTF